MSADSPDRFEPSAQQKAKQGKSASKRIALFVFIGAGIIFTLVATSILNSGGGVNGSNAPVNLFEASRGAQSIAPPRPKPPEPEPIQAPPTPPAPKPQPVRPAYSPVPKVSDMRKQNQVQRLLAANAPTSIQAFREQTNNGGGSTPSGNNSDTLAEVSRLLSMLRAVPLTLLLSWLYPSCLNSKTLSLTLTVGTERTLSLNRICQRNILNTPSFLHAVLLS